MRIEIHSTETRPFGWDKKNKDGTVKTDASGNPIREERDAQPAWIFFDDVPFPTEIEVHAPEKGKPYEPGVYKLSRRSFEFKPSFRLAFGVPLTRVGPLPTSTKS